MNIKLNQFLSVCLYTLATLFVVLQFFAIARIQVSSILLNKNISVSQCRKQNFLKSVAGKEYKV